MRRAITGASLILAVLILAGCSVTEGGQAVAASTVSAGPASTAAPDSTGSSPGASEPAPSPTVGRTVTVTTTPTSGPASTAPSTPGSNPSTTGRPVTPRPNAAPACWSDQSCPAVARVGLPGGWSVAVVNAGATASLMLLLSGGQVYDQLGTRDLGAHPVLTCLTVSGAPTCLMSGVPGAHTAFGAVARVVNGRLMNLTRTEIASEGGFDFRSTDATHALIVGTVAFYDYGVSYAAAPKAYVTYTVTTSITKTGCSAPAFEPPTPPTTPQTGPCSGTPPIAGYTAGSAAKILDLGGGIVSASGNLWCVDQPYGSGEVDCTISKTDFAVPTGCVGEPGTIVRWPAGGTPTLSGCQGDTMVNAGRQPIAYGQLAMSGDVICVVAQTGGVRCENFDHHGFVLSRAKFTAF
ncbi:hypothetical protein SAMN04515671_2705 [Nakamurella panacisegetis]|uniref:Uncharacterized protein n=1 Tax=Nakamurella panacisegetis TaxID=1090615 RepID=A0A1H0PBP3_9ACTN|nr:hypothetical protein [Nakamurella panacisegetis]SDP02414.1 hypothetical protein SAMN04515671_2705 [Nakamurella panacisegetis]